MNQLEARIRRRLDETHPCSTLSGVTLYRPDRFGSDDPFGYEIDNLLHWQNGIEDRLLILECKDAPILIARTRASIPDQNQEWYVPTRDGRKNVKDQLFNEAESVWQNLCVPPTLRRRIDAFVISSQASTPALKCDLYSLHGLTIHLVSEMGMLQLLQQPDTLAAVLDAPVGGRFLRIAQSGLLRLARQNVIVDELGHPEIDHAIELIGRCRQTLDGRLFDFFRPKERRWAINGAAGMGKTVLLAYTATAFSSGKMLRDVPRNANERIPLSTELVDHADETLLLPELNKRRILVLGLKQRQLRILEHAWRDFFSRFQRLSGHYLPHAQPSFQVWHPMLDFSKFNIILIDEAHDLDGLAQRQIAEWWTKQEQRRYLVIACDRHQKLRLSGGDDEKWMLNGVPFAGCSTRLTRNYRSPTPVYCAALALMFRWFAPAGPKVVPERAELENSFGFRVDALERRIGGEVSLSTINDAHPANHWCYTTSRFTDTAAAFEWLNASKLGTEDVLWVRFGPQDPEADYEEIKNRFNYKPLVARDSDDTIDAEIKGREFPVVIIEGLPGGMASAEPNSRMWALRRQVYLCASRATAFLFFVFRTGGVTQEMRALEQELEGMLGALCAPRDRNAASTKKWSFSFKLQEPPVSMDVFLDEAEAGTKPSDDTIPAREPEAGVNVDRTEPAWTPPKATIPSAPIPLQRQEHEAVPLPAVERGAIPDLPDTIRNGDTKHANTPAERAAGMAHGTTQLPIVPIVAKPLSSELNGVVPPVIGAPPAPTAPPAPVGGREASASTNKSSTHPESPVRLTEKEFQRRYGQEKGWKQLYFRHVETGQLPTYRPRIQPAVFGRPNGDAHRRPAVTQSRPLPPVSAILAAAVPPRPSPTVAQIARHLGLKPFEVFQAISALGRPDLFGGLDTPIPRPFVDRICVKLGRRVFSEDQLNQMVTKPVG